MALTVENDAYMRDIRQRALALDSIPVTGVSDVIGETELPPPSLPHFIFTAVVLPQFGLGERPAGGRVENPQGVLLAHSRGELVAICTL